ncbi:MAG: hypothetical protein M5U08_08100 [Burkholderiales bacterium]|nr:hypothetical protein [Burkholderiales bacterium]
MKRLVYLFLAALVPGPSAFGHEGEDHGPPPTPAVQTSIPRVAAVSEAFELVGVVSGGNLVVYLDRFPTNAPVTGATLELESGALKALGMAASEPGMYTVPLGALASPGRHALVFSVTVGNESDLLSGTLDISRPPDEAHGHAWSEWLTWTVGGAVLLVGIGWLVLRRARRTAG